MTSPDERLMRRAEEALAEIGRTQGLADRHADVLAALRIRLEGGPRKSLDEVLKAAGDLSGRPTLDDPPPPPAKPSLEDVVRKASARKEWPGSGA